MKPGHTEPEGQHIPRPSVRDDEGSNTMTATGGTTGTLIAYGQQSGGISNPPRTEDTAWAWEKT
jgi:hypothetical protein